MSYIKNWIKFWLVSWLTIIFTLLISWVIFAAWTNISELEVQSWDKLDSNKWNLVMSNVDILKVDNETIKNDTDLLKEEIETFKNNTNLLEEEITTLKNQIESITSATPSWAVPSKWVLAFALPSCPEWWSPADWSAKVWKLDLRWMFIRWANNFGTTTTSRDYDRYKEGKNTVVEWSFTPQGDAIRKITWYVKWYWKDQSWWFQGWERDWAFTTIYTKDSTNYPESLSTKWTLWVWFYFDSSGSVPSWTDNRPVNVALIYCVKD